jgi:hypothetical protein
MTRFKIIYESLKSFLSIECHESSDYSLVLGVILLDFFIDFFGNLSILVKFAICFERSSLNEQLDKLSVVIAKSDEGYLDWLIFFCTFERARL